MFDRPLSASRETVTDVQMFLDRVQSRSRRSDIAQGVFDGAALIATSSGHKAIADLGFDDLIFTRDHGYQRLSGLRRVATVEDETGDIRLARGSLGRNLPENDMRISSNHPLIVAQGGVDAVVFADDLVSGRTGVHQTQRKTCSYLVFFEFQQFVRVNGIWMSSSIAASRSPRAAKVVNGFSFDPIENTHVAGRPILRSAQIG
jgi:hypothetical protein